MCENYNKIDLSFEKSFNIKKNNWKNSLDIIFDNDDDINLINLFLILKSYLLSNKIIVEKMYIIIKNLEFDFIIVYKNVNVYEMYKLNINEFVIWYNMNLNNEYEYIKKSEICGIRFVFYKLDNDIYPKYPWSEDWKNYNNLHQSI